MDLSRYVRDARVLTDDHPTIEFFTGGPIVEEPVHLERLLPHRMDPEALERALGGAGRSGDSLDAESEDLRRHRKAMDHYLRGALLGVRGEGAAARQEWRAALEADPGNPFWRGINGLGVL